MKPRAERESEPHHPGLKLRGIQRGHIHADVAAVIKVGADNPPLVRGGAIVGHGSGALGARGAA